MFILRYVSAGLKGTKEASTIGQLSQMLLSSYLQLSYSSQKTILLSSSIASGFYNLSDPSSSMIPKASEEGMWYGSPVFKTKALYPLPMFSHRQHSIRDN